MPSIRGRYEYDDPSLRPGIGKEGGLHQNLFDQEGKLRANARFIPNDPNDREDAYQPDPVYVHVYVNEEPRQRSKEDQEFEDAIARLLSMLIGIGIEKARPHARRLWQEKARPALAATWDRRPRRHTADPETQATEPVVIDATGIAEPSVELAVALEEYRSNMSSAEAQARYLVALAAKAFSDEQMRLLANANIDDGSSLTVFEHGLAQLPPQQVTEIIEALEADPSALTQVSVDKETALAVTRMERARLALRKRKN